MNPRHLLVVVLLAPAIGVGFFIMGDRPTPCVADLDGQIVRPLAVENSHVTVLIFVTPACPISNRYIPTIRDLSQTYTVQGVTFWLVYPDSDVSDAEVQAHLREYQLELPAVRDPRRELADAAQATTVPEAAVFVRRQRQQSLIYHGRIDDRFFDFGITRPQATMHDLREAIAAGLSGTTPTIPFQPAIGCPIP